ncbi:MAG: class I SAM-dependent methyltransferase, partial [Oscillospiraceae bacterium]|nr:class I SAM-dependent methyltransferase [Oscillospiraceae bacterium]
MIFYKEDAEIHLSIKERAPFMSAGDFRAVYSGLKMDVLNRETDLNKQSIDMIIQNIKGQNVLDIACGKGYLTKLLANRGYQVIGVDFSIPNISQRGGGGGGGGGICWGGVFKKSFFGLVFYTFF